MNFNSLAKNLVLLLLISGSLLASNAGQSYQYIDCTITPKTEQAEQCSHPHIPGPKILDKRKKQAAQETSTNWSGYVAANNISNPGQNTVTAVYGSWIVPTVIASSPSATNYSAFWIGIDGFSSASVEQIGTSHDYHNGQQNSAWFEMYPGGSYTINGFPLNPGDVISASVIYSGNSIFTMTLYNDTQKVAYTIPTSYTTSPTAKRSSAEWIIEAPYSNGILPLSDFKTGYMWGCIANINGVLNVLNNNSWQNVSLEMTTNTGAAKAMPSAVLQDNGSFFVTWDHQ